MASREENVNLSTAAKKGDKDAVTTSLRRGGDPLSRDSYGMTPLMWAAWVGSSECVEILLPISDPNAKEAVKGLTPLMWAARFGHERCVDLLLKKGNPKDVDSDGRTASIWAIEGGFACLGIKIGSMIEAFDLEKLLPMEDSGNSRKTSKGKI